MSDHVTLLPWTETTTANSKLTIAVTCVLASHDIDFGGMAVPPHLTHFYSPQRRTAPKAAGCQRGTTARRGARQIPLASRSRMLPWRGWMCGSVWVLLCVLQDLVERRAATA